jgi:hypothetical protein
MKVSEGRNGVRQKLKHDGYRLQRLRPVFRGNSKEWELSLSSTTCADPEEWSVTHFALQAKMLNDITLRRRKYLNGQAAGQTATR